MGAIHNHKTAPVHAGIPNHYEPEFIRPKDLNAIAGIKRGHAFELIRDGTIKSVLLRPEGSGRGIRLIHWASVKSYLLDLMQKQECERMEESKKEGTTQVA